MVGAGAGIVGQRAALYCPRLRRAQVLIGAVGYVYNQVRAEKSTELGERCGYSGCKSLIGKTRSPPSLGAPPTRSRPTNALEASGPASCDTWPPTSRFPSPWTNSSSARAASTPAPPGSVGVMGEVRQRGPRDGRREGDRRRCILIVFMRFRLRLVHCAELVKKTAFLNKCSFGRDQHWFGRDQLAITAGNRRPHRGSPIQGGSGRRSLPRSEIRLVRMWDVSPGYAYAPSYDYGPGLRKPTCMSIRLRAPLGIGPPVRTLIACRRELRAARAGLRANNQTGRRGSRRLGDGRS
jgi:hypothetical protein